MYTVNLKIDDAKPGMTLASSVYHTTGGGSQMLVARKDSILTENTLRVLTSMKIETIDVVSRRAKPEVYTPVTSLFSEELRIAAIDNVRELFECFTLDGCRDKTVALRCVGTIDGVVGDLLTVVDDQNSGLIHINDLKPPDEYTLHHSLSVSVLAIATGRELGMADDEIKRLGRCAMLHDIGKQLVPSNLLNKEGKLTVSEFEIVQKHPIWGADNLRKASLIDEDSIMSILAHHEKENGSGYPYNLKGNEIPLFSKIISVADVYDAITSFRSYRIPIQPIDAFNIIFNDIGESFDYDIVRAFYNRLEFFPVNTIVELSNNRIALVSHTGKLKLRPTVRIWGADEFINLEAAKDIEIKRILKPNELPQGFKFF